MACVEGPRVQPESWNSPQHIQRTEEDRILGLLLKTEQHQLETTDIGGSLCRLTVQGKASWGHVVVQGHRPSSSREASTDGLSVGGGLGPRTHLVGRVIMRVEKSNRSRLILRRFCTSSSSSVIRIRSWSWPPSTFFSIVLHMTLCSRSARSR